MEGQSKTEIHQYRRLELDQISSSAVVIEGRLTMDNGCCSAAPAVELECSYNSCCKMQDVHLFNSDAEAGVVLFVTVLLMLNHIKSSSTFHVSLYSKKLLLSSQAALRS